MHLEPKRFAITLVCVAPDVEFPTLYFSVEDCPNRQRECYNKKPVLQVETRSVPGCWHANKNDHPRRTPTTPSTLQNATKTNCVHRPPSPCLVPACTTNPFPTTPLSPQEASTVSSHLEDHWVARPTQQRALLTRLFQWKADGGGKEVVLLAGAGRAEGCAAAESRLELKVPPPQTARPLDSAVASEAVTVKVEREGRATEDEEKEKEKRMSAPRRVVISQVLRIASTVCSTY